MSGAGQGQRETAHPETPTWMKDRKQRSCRFSLVKNWLYILLLQTSANTLLLYSNSFKYPRNKFLLFDKSSLICPHPRTALSGQGRLNRQISCCRAFPEACLERLSCRSASGTQLAACPAASEVWGQAAGHRPHTRAASVAGSPAVTPAPHVFARAAPWLLPGSRPGATCLQEPGRPWWSGPASPAPAVLCPSLVMLEASPLSLAPCGLCLVSLGQVPVPRPA